jgi:DNA-binding response OmpR family regulator
MRILMIDIPVKEEKEIKAFLEKEGHSLLITDSARNAIKLIESDNHIDVILLGYSGMDGSGCQVLKFVKTSNRYCWLPALVLGKSFDEQSVRLCHEFGANGIAALPVSNETLKARIEMAHANGKRRVLVVDDEQPILEILKSFLELERFIVMTAESAEQALELLDQNKVHLIVSDILLPGMSGIELLQKIKENHPNMPVILITGYAGKYGPEDAISAGANGYFIKPFKNIELVYTLRQVLRHNPAVNSPETVAK